MTTQPTEFPILELQDIAMSIGRQAADLVRDRRSQGVNVAYSKSAIADIVTEADRETETLIRALLAKARPDDGFCGEEFEPTPTRSGITWVVDPIDGTVNYLYGMSPSAVSIAAVAGDVLTDDWTPLAGAVVDISGRETYSAASGHGAFLNGRRLKTGETSDLRLTLVSTGFCYEPVLRVKQAEIVAKLLGQVRDIRRIGCASLEMCAVAAGRVDFSFEYGLSPWDYAASTLIAREAGAVVASLDGSQPNERLAFAGNPQLVSMLRPMLKQWFQEAGI